ncbi:flagellar assembly protein FliW [Paenibacillus sp. MMS20-IR301]|uniref:flagellar assembly protein FliW n=1 Tax=Paenibacillus sp. MMS20-IR301 TaxID=2895946 RepID=UPI0028E45CD8|nr:flagellar assembly protein FliW [Paenibacillus sp. MMS20-IR301]WNS42665.1 flagellar assembly protein FliW [Paenibacillus sp. MMS20-IR301]
MNIKTLTWGTLNIKDEQIYHFSKGIPGFEEEVDFALITVEDGPFSYLQSLRNQSVSFLLSDPFVFYSSYEFELSEADKEELEIVDQVNVLCIVTIKEELESSTVNLLAPIVLNPVKRSGKQVVLHKSNYQARHGLWSASQNYYEKGGE